MTEAIEGSTFPVPTIDALDEAKLRAHLIRMSVDARRTLLAYIDEAQFFRRFLDDDIRRLRRGAKVVEIGSGIGLLARLVAAEGHDVVAFEPESAGFDQMDVFNAIVEDCWLGSLPVVEFVSSSFDARTCPREGVDLVVAVNVVEHVPDPADLIADATSVLSPGGAARFICPNYAFPYEPHFNIPTAINKTATAVFAKRAIARSEIPDAAAFWAELSWPSVRRLRREVGRHPSVEARFTRLGLLAYVDRLADAEFAERKGFLFRFARRALRPGVRIVARLLPLTIAPIIDLTTTRCADRPTSQVDPLGPPCTR